MKILTHISRTLVGVLFILSGWIKANDTLGFSYKLEEYFEIFHLEFMIPFAVGLAMFICIFEIMCGVVLLLGAFVRLNSWLLLLMIIFFTLLTGYSAITGKVTDCGCFGDAIKLKPVQSFLKDLVLLVFILIIFIRQKHIQPITNKGIMSIFIFISLLVTSFFTFYTYMFLPVVDFLPYKIGNDIKALASYPPGAPRDEYEMIFMYDSIGVKKEFDMNHIPTDTNWHFVDRKDKLVKKGYEPPVKDFKIYDSGGIEYNDSLLDAPGYKLVIVQKNIPDGREAAFHQLSVLSNDWAKNYGTRVWALSSSPHEITEAFRHQYQIAADYFSMDAVPLKSMVRSNPGVMLMHNSTIVKKWSAYSIPDFETVTKYMK